MSSKLLIESVAFILVKGDKVLVEKRKLDKLVDPGIIAIPSGKIEEGETPEQALVRETQEEFSIKTTKYKSICTLPYETPKVNFNVHYFVVAEWVGEIKNNEAEELSWIQINDFQTLQDVDLQALKILKKLGTTF